MSVYCELLKKIITINSNNDMENVLKPKINKQITLYWWFFEEAEKMPIQKFSNLKSVG